MKVRAALAVILAVMLVASIAAAQTTAGAKNDGTRGACRLKLAQALQLTDAQKQSIADILSDLREKCRPIVQSEMSKEEKISAVTQLREAARADILNVLTDEQRQKAEESGILDRLAAPRRTGPQSWHREGFRHAVAQLNLTEEQKARIRDVLAASTEKVSSLRNDTTLTTEQKRSAALEIRNDTKNAIMQILTPQQQSKWQEWLDKNQPLR